MKNKNIPLPLTITEKRDENKWDKTKVVVRTEEEINSYKRSVGYRKARVKRYGMVPAKKAK